MKLMLPVYALLLALVAARGAEPLEPLAAFGKDTRILFQGDSITDGNRGRNADPNHILGHGYAFIIAAKFGAEFAERNLTFINRGISGNTVLDLEKRWQKHGAALVRFQRVFDDASRRVAAEYWNWDGVHPTYSGHQLMADEWVRTVNAFWTPPK